MAALGLDEAALLQGPQQHDRTGDRERQAEHDAAADAPAHEPGEAHAQHRGAGDLHDGAGNGDGADREEILQGEMKADAEHQQNDADFRQLVGEPLVRHVAGREGADEHAGEQIADERGKAEPMRNGAESKCQNQADNDG